MLVGDGGDEGWSSSHSFFKRSVVALTGYCCIVTRPMNSLSLSLPLLLALSLPGKINEDTKRLFTNNRAY